MYVQYRQHYINTARAESEKGQIVPGRWLSAGQGDEAKLNNAAIALC